MIKTYTKSILLATERLYLIPLYLISKTSWAKRTVFAVFFSCVALLSTLKAADRYAVATGNWNLTTTWSATPGGASGASAPLAADNVFIEGGFAVTTNNSASAVACNNLTINNGTLTIAQTTSTRTFTVNGFTNVGGTGNGTLNITSATTTSTHLFVGIVTIASGSTWNNSTNKAVSFQSGITNNGTFTAGTGVHTFDTNNQTITGITAIPSVTVNIVTLTTPDASTLAISTALAGTGTFKQSLNSVLNLNGTSAITTLDAATNANTVNYTGGTQTIKAATYKTITFSAGTKTLSNPIVIDGDLTVGDGTIITGGTAALTVNGTTTIGGGTSGAISFTTAAKIFVGTVTINTGATWSNTTGVCTFRNGITNNGTFTAGTGVHTFNTNNQIITGITAIPSVTVNIVTLTTPDASTLAISTALAGTGTFKQSLNSVLNLGGTSAITTLDAATNANTVNYNRIGTQTIKGTTYDKINLSDGVKTLATSTITGTCTIDASATLAVSTQTLTVNGGAAIAVNGILDFTSTSGLIKCGTSGTSTLTMGASGIVKTVDIALGPLANASIQNQVGGTWDLSSISTNGTVEYNAPTAAQTITNRDYNNLTLTSNTTSVKTWTPSGSPTVNGDFTQVGNFTISGVAQTVNVKGNWIYTSGTFTPGTSIINFNGTVAQSIIGATTFRNVTVNNSTGLSIANDETVSGTLILTNGNITTSTNKITVGIAGTAGTVTRASGHIVGNLERFVSNAATPSVTFDIGDATNYTPAVVNFVGTTAGSGSITASTTLNDHPQIGTSGLLTAKSVNRYWTLTNNGITGFTSYSPTFTFVSADVDAGATTGNFVISKYNGASWAFTTAGTRTGTTTQATGLTSFSDFQIGELIPTITTSAISGSPFCAGATVLVPYTTTGTMTGTFTAQLSDANGSFASPLSIGTGSSPITATIPSNTVAGTAYRIRVVNNTPSTTGTDNGADLTINALPTITAQTTATATYCTNGTASALSVTATGTSLTYQWYSNTTASNSDGIIISIDGTSASYTPIITTLGTTYYYCVVSGTCTPSVTSAVSGAIIVNGIPTASAGGTTTICSNGTATVSGASSSNGAILWTHNGGGSIADATALTPTYTADVTDAGKTVTLTMTVSNAPCTAATATYSVIVNTPSVGGTASAAQTICSGSTPSDITLTSNIGIIQWQSSTTSVSAGFMDISGQTGATLTGVTIGALTATTYYRAVVTSGVCTAANSNAVTITVNPTLTATISGSATICNGTTTIITFTGSPNAVVTYKIDVGSDLTATLNGSGTAAVTTAALATTTTAYTLVSVAYASVPYCVQTITDQTAVITFTQCSQRLAAKVFIQGAYNVSTGFMNDGLRANDRIPTTQPYKTLTFAGATDYLGTETFDKAILATPGANAIVDWVLIEIRDETTPASVVQRRAALLQRDGDVVDMDGASAVGFEGLPNGNYHVVIRHRLCLATRTQTAVNFAVYSPSTPTSSSLDFTSNSNALSSSQKLLTTGIYGLYIGDTDRSGIISVTDIDNTRSRNPTTPATFIYNVGYDMDFNAGIYSTDIILVRANSSISQVNLN
jgi:hypothetical protein